MKSLAPGTQFRRGFRAPSVIGGNRIRTRVMERSRENLSSAPSLEANKHVGVLLLNLGGPDKLEDVEPFLYNLFADPDILRLQPPLSILQPLIARIIAAVRAPQSREGYSAIGGGSPLRKLTEEQGQALQQSLTNMGLKASVYVGMRYWHPFTEEAVNQIKRDQVTHLVILPLYPQFSISTSGSSLRLLETILRSDPELDGLQHTVIPSWYYRPGYVKAMCDLIQQELEGPNYRALTADQRKQVNIFFSAHGVPLSYITENGDPYKEEMEECINLIMDELRRRDIHNPYTLAYQSRVGPVQWLKPYTEDAIKELGEKGCPGLCTVPVSFVSEHIETLEEIDMEYREVAEEAGIKAWGRVPALNSNADFINDLASAVLEALPYMGGVTAGAPQMPVSPTSTAQTDALVPIGDVRTLLEAYDREKPFLPVPESEFGWTSKAEAVNGRLAMMAVLLIIVAEITTGEGIVSSFLNLF